MSQPVCISVPQLLICKISLVCLDKCFGAGTLSLLVSTVQLPLKVLDRAPLVTVALGSGPVCLHSTEQNGAVILARPSRNYGDMDNEEEEELGY